LKQTQTLGTKKSVSSIFEILKYFFFTLIIFWFNIYCLVPKNSSRLITAISCSVAGLIALTFLSVICVKKNIFKKNLIIIILIAYLIRVIFGFSHYLISIDNTYFNGYSSFAYLWDYEWLSSSMIDVSDYWNNNGFGTFSPDFLLSNKNPIITAYITLIYFLGDNNHFLNIVIVNSFHNVLVAILVSSICHNLNITNKSSTVLLICLFQPLGFASDIFWRDSVGQFFVVVSISLLFDAKINLKGLLLLLSSFFLTFIHRTAYIIANLLIYIYSNYKISNLKRNIFTKFLTFSFLIFCIFYFNIEINNITNFNAYVTNEGSTNTAISNGGSFFVFIKGLLGPFPWYQIYNTSVTGREYLLYDMLQASFCLVIYYTATKEFILNYKIILEKKEKIIIFSVLIYMAYGLFSYGHIPYTTIISILLLAIIKNLNILIFLRNWLFLVLSYCFFSLIWFFIKL